MEVQKMMEEGQLPWIALKKTYKTLEVASPTKLQTCASLSIDKTLTLKDMLKCLEELFQMEIPKLIEENRLEETSLQPKTLKESDERNKFTTQELP